MPDVVLITESGTFSLDSVSGGIAALIGIAWQLHMYGVDKDKFAVTFDEPENHLHPAMQRELLPNLERAFPKARFVIATHSPFIVTSNPNAQIYSLSFKNGKVTSRHLKESELSGDYNETLQQILDVPITIPKWVEAAVKDAYHEAVKTGVTEESIQQFKKELERLRLYPSLFHFPNLPEGDDA
jgi:predicted ATP-binding protein involved in virulence